LESKKQKLKPESPKIEVCKYRSWSAGTYVVEKKIIQNVGAAKSVQQWNTSKNLMPRGVLEVII
jgi:hypothetical protein